MTMSHLFLLCLLLSFLNFTASQDDATIMQSLKSSLNLTSDVDWSNANPCKWMYVICDQDNRVSWIQLKMKGITGTLPQDLGKLTQLTILEFYSNKISGSIPDLSGLTQLDSLDLHDNLFDSTPKNLFSGMNSLHEIYLDNNPLTAWEIPETIKEAKSLKFLSLSNCNVTGPIPDLSGLQSLKMFNVRENQLTGVFPPSLTGLKSLTVVNLTNNCFQGPTPSFNSSVAVDVIANTNSFCLDTPGARCDPRVETLVSIAEAFGYPVKLAKSWKGNDPCGGSWLGITCSGSNVTVVNLGGQELTGTISPSFAKLTSLERIYLSDNQLTGSIPTELTTLPELRTLDVSNNNINITDMPKFSGSVNVVTSANGNIGNKRTCLKATGGTHEEKE